MLNSPLFSLSALLLLCTLSTACSQGKKTPTTANVTASNQATPPSKAPAPPALALTTEPSQARQTLTALMTSLNPLVAPLDPLILGQLAAQDWPTASKLLDLIPSDPKTQPHLSFLKAYVALQSAQYDPCTQQAVDAAPQLGLLEHDAYFVAAECAREAKRWNDAATYAAKVPQGHVLYERALFLLAEMLYALGEKSERPRTARVLRTYLQTYSRGDRADQARLMLARLLEVQGEVDQAALTFNAFMLLSPLSDDVPDAAAGIDRLRSRLTKDTLAQIKRTEDEQKLNLLEALFDRHRSQTVVEQGRKMIQEITLKLGKKGPTDKERAFLCEVGYMIGRSFSKLRDHQASIPAYVGTLGWCEQGSTRMRTYYMLGKAYWNVGNRPMARETFAKIWEEYAQESYADDAMLYAARIMLAQGDREEAAAMLERQLDRYPKGDMAKDARWLTVSGLLERQDHKAVVAYIDGIDDPGEDDVYTQGRLAYFRARSLEALGRKVDALAAYRALATLHPMGYYALLSLNRVAKLEGLIKEDTSDLCTLLDGTFCDFLWEDPVARMGPIEVPESLRKHEALERGAIFLSLGLLVPAEREFQRLRAAFSSTPEALWALAMLLDAAGSYSVSHDIPRRAIKDWQTQYPVGQAKEKWHVAYPNPFEEIVTRWSALRGIEPAMVWGIMREESGFNPRVESWANARGLIQLMEATAAGQAKKDGLLVFDKEALFDPEINVRLGTSYIKELGGAFGHHPALMIAGYNGGAGNVNRWLREFGQKPLDLFVEDIPYGQTRDYTKRVLTSFWAYSWLIQNCRAPLLPFDLK